MELTYTNTVFVQIIPHRSKRAEEQTEVGGVNYNYWV